MNMKPSGFVLFFVCLFLLVCILILLFCTCKSNEHFNNTQKTNTHQYKQFAFIHIPKTAGTTITTAFKAMDIPMGEYYNWGLDSKVGICSGWHIPPYKLPDKVYDEFYKDKNKFLVCRNPYDRIVSEYRFIKKITNENTTPNDLNDWIHSLEGNDIYHNYDQDCHLLPQVEYLRLGDRGDGKGEIGVLYMENLEEDLKEYFGRYSMEPPKLKSKKGDTITNKHNTTDNKVTVKDLDSKSIDIISDLYDEDFRRFGYEKNIVS